MLHILHKIVCFRHCPCHTVVPSSASGGCHMRPQVCRTSSLNMWKRLSQMHWNQMGHPRKKLNKEKMNLHIVSLPLGN